MGEVMTLCHTCLERRVRILTENGAHFIIWGCGLKRIRFGSESEYRAGKNQPKKCEGYRK